ncbi:hypothetical protein F4678DRAFT_227916 [Xylaria arbuscula]|nr:hypothetical protein F4678DRAFT_227916 [Xylaria arbuscula]
MSSRLRPRLEATPRSLPTTGRCTRSSIRLREAPIAKIRAQSSFSRRSSRKKDALTATDKTSPGKGHAPSRRHSQDVIIPQRSSLRRALRDSQRLSGGFAPTTTSSPLDLAPAEFQVPPQEPKDHPTHGAQVGVDTTVTCPTEKPHVISSKAMPQRSSFRRANRESLKDLVVDYKYPVPPSTIPQRSSLRLAIRESQSAVVQSNAYVDLPSSPSDINSGQESSFEYTTKESPSNSDGQSDSILSLPNSPAASSDTSLAFLEERDVVRTLLQLSCTPSISSVTESPAPLTPATPKLLTTRPSVSRCPFSPPELYPHTVSTLGLPICRGSNSPTPVSQQQSSNLPSMGRSIPGGGTVQNIPDNEKLRINSSNSQSLSARKGWHHVRQITNEVPGGRYLVEWEGYDPRTGVNWPASWVTAQNVSKNAIRDWEDRKHQILLDEKFPTKTGSERRVM